MTRKKKPETPPQKGKRLFLHPCHLQGMYGDGFVKTANQVLRGQLTLLRYCSGFSTETGLDTAAN